MVNLGLGFRLGLGLALGLGSGLWSGLVSWVVNFSTSADFLCFFVAVGKMHPNNAITAQ